MNKKKPLLYTKDLTKEYVIGEVITKVLKGVSIEIHEGDFVAIMGHSGSGKSTLMHILGLLDTPTSGDYVFNNQNTNDLNEESLAEIRNKQVGFVFQAFNLLARTSAIDNVRLPMIYAGIEEAEQIKRAEKALKAVGLEHRMNNLSNELSGGEQQRVAVARALINEPKIILADEPTGNLDSTSTKDIMKLFDQLHNEGHTLVIVTHEDDVASHAKRTIRMKDGICTEQ